MSPAQRRDHANLHKTLHCLQMHRDDPTLFRRSDGRGVEQVHRDPRLPQVRTEDLPQLIDLALGPRDRHQLERVDEPFVQLVLDNGWMTIASDAMDNDHLVHQFPV